MTTKTNAQTVLKPQCWLENAILFKFMLKENGHCHGPFFPYNNLFRNQQYISSPTARV
jgi:hypothetical protein